MVKSISQEKLNKLNDVGTKFTKSCRQIRVLDRQMDILQLRYDRANKQRSRAAFHSLRLQLTTVEGVRQAFYEYACRRSAEKNFLEAEIIEEMRASEE